MRTRSRRPNARSRTVIVHRDMAPLTRAFHVLSAGAAKGHAGKCFSKGCRRRRALTHGIKKRPHPDGPRVRAPGQAGALPITGIELALGEVGALPVRQIVEEQAVEIVAI